MIAHHTMMLAHHGGCCIVLGLAPLGNFRTWRSVCCFLQSVHAGLSFFQWNTCKLELCGSMSTAALRAKFISVSGSDWTIEAQIEALVG